MFDHSPKESQSSMPMLDPTYGYDSWEDFLLEVRDFYGDETEIVCRRMLGEQDPGSSVDPATISSAAEAEVVKPSRDMLIRSLITPLDSYIEYDFTKSEIDD